LLMGFSFLWLWCWRLLFLTKGWLKATLNSLPWELPNMGNSQYSSLVLQSCKEKGRLSSCMKLPCCVI
jgi:hypothetical protein